MTVQNPVLVEITRGVRVESTHRGAFAVCGPDGRLASSIGDVSCPVYPRSAIKLVQALGLVTSGAADRFGFETGQLAMACASHSGGPAHVAAAQAMLAGAGVSPEALVCGAHLPIGEAEAHALLRAGGETSRCHNNCSGKHAGMLATAQHLGETLEGYHEAWHPVQREIRERLERLCDARLADTDMMGVDGCGAPNWAIPLAGLATGFARLITGEQCVDDDARAADKLMRACWSAPEMMAGEGRLDTTVLRRLPGEVFIKSGAEGVFCGAIRSRGLGFALKVDDGAKRGSEAVVRALIARLAAGGSEFDGPWPLENWDGRVVGETRLSADAVAAISRL